MKAGNIIRIEIEDLAAGGRGVGRVGGKAVFVPLSVTGDSIEAVIEQSKKKFDTARLTGIITPSPFRVKPKCPYFTVCGGCDWQHIKYGEQLKAKTEILKRQIMQIAGLKQPPPVFEIGMKNEYGYRRRLRLLITENGLPAFRKRYSNEAVEINRCLVAEKPLNAVIEKLALKSAREICKKLSLNELALVSSSQGKTAAFATGESKLTREKTEKLLNELSGVCGLEGIKLKALRETITAGDDFVTETDPLDREERLMPEHFAQSNLEGNLALRRIVKEICISEKVSGKCLELFCGSGNLTFLLAEFFDKVTAVEYNREAVNEGAKTAKKLRRENISFIAEDTGKYLTGVADDRFNTVVLDPPRKGLGIEGSHKIAKLKPENIFYVSCEPSKMARDIKIFLDCGYSIGSLHLIDMFPQTAHFEAVATLAAR